MCVPETVPTDVGENGNMIFLSTQNGRNLMKNFDELGIMIDCSRNAVMSPARVRDYIRMMSKLGYTYLMLYTEDTYEVDGEPYFGYLRGRYSRDELKELDTYATENGIELIPCIQTLAHLPAIMQWDTYSQNVRDLDDVLLIGADRTYELLEHMFASLRSCFSTRRIHIGMDEAYRVGLGRYRDLHGNRPRFEILTEHLKKVCEIADRYDFRPMLWNDMFYHLAKESGMVEKAKETIPQQVTLVYWDYYRSTEEEYTTRIRENKQLCENLIFAGGAWCWNGFAPDNVFSVKATRAAFTSCIREGVRSAFITMWGDDGSECSRDSVLPSLVWAAALAENADATEEDVKVLFREVVGGEYDDFMLLDLPNCIPGKRGAFQNPCKYLLYNDPLIGYLDYTVPEGVPAVYADHARVLAEAAVREPAYRVLFENLSALCSVLERKADLGVRLRSAYQKNDKATVSAIAKNDCPAIVAGIDVLIGTMRRQWMRENKPYGFELHEIRLGGLKERIMSVAARLNDWVDGKVESIPELQDAILPALEGREPGEGICRNSWIASFTVSRMM